MKNLFEKIRGFFTSPSYTRTLALIGLLVLILVLPITIIFLGKQTVFTPHASGTCAGAGGSCVDAAKHSCAANTHNDPNYAPSCVGNSDYYCCVPNTPSGCTPTSSTPFTVCSNDSSHTLYNETKDNCGTTHIISSVANSPSCGGTPACVDQTSNYTQCVGTTLQVWQHHTCSADVMLTSTPNAPSCFAPTTPTPPIQSGFCQSLGGTCFGGVYSQPPVGTGGSGALPGNVTCQNSNIYGQPTDCSINNRNGLCCLSKLVTPTPSPCPSQIQIGSGWSGGLGQGYDTCSETAVKNTLSAMHSSCTDYVGYEDRLTHQDVGGAIGSTTSFYCNYSPSSTSSTFSTSNYQNSSCSGPGSICVPVNLASSYPSGQACQNAANSSASSQNPGGVSDNRYIQAHYHYGYNGNTSDGSSAAPACGLFNRCCDPNTGSTAPAVSSSSVACLTRVANPYTVTNGLGQGSCTAVNSICVPSVSFPSTSSVPANFKQSNGVKCVDNKGNVGDCYDYQLGDLWHIPANTGHTQGSCTAVNSICIPSVFPGTSNVPANFTQDPNKAKCVDSKSNLGDCYNYTGSICSAGGSSTGGTNSSTTGSGTNGGTGGGGNCTAGQSTAFSIALKLEGIGTGALENSSPAHPTRTAAYVTVKDESGNTIYNQLNNAQFTYNTTSGTFNSSNINVGASCGHTYTVTVKLPGYVKASGTVTYGNTSQTISLNPIQGDFVADNNNSQITPDGKLVGDDQITVNDYALFRDTACGKDVDPNKTIAFTNNTQTINIKCSDIINLFDYADGGTQGDEWSFNYNLWARGYFKVNKF